MYTITSRERDSLVEHLSGFIESLGDEAVNNTSCCSVIMLYGAVMISMFEICMAKPRPQTAATSLMNTKSSSRNTLSFQSKHFGAIVGAVQTKTPSPPHSNSFSVFIPILCPSAFASNIPLRPPLSME